MILMIEEKNVRINKVRTAVGTFVLSKKGEH